MYDLISLTKRHMIKFLRDKTAVFFSFLSVLILLALYFLFIGEQYTNDPDLAFLTQNEKVFITAGIMMGGILVINTVSLSLGIMGNIITDLELHKLDAFLVTPVKRYKIILSYYLSAILVTSVLSIFMWSLTVLYVGLTAGYWYTLTEIFIVIIMLIIFTFVSSSMMIYLTTLMKSVNAFGTLSGILGTFIGFACGIYMPLIQLGTGVKYIASVIPFTHMSIELKQVLLERPYEIMASHGIPDQDMDFIRQVYGSSEIGVLGMNTPMWIISIGSVLISIAFLYLAYRRMTRKMGKI